MSWMTKHTKNLLGDMPIDDKSSALNHTSFPVHEHPHSVKGKSYTKEVKDLPKKGNITKNIRRMKVNMTKNIKPIDGSKQKDVVKL